MSIVVRVLEPPSFKHRDHTKPKQLSECGCGDTSQQAMERSTLPVPVTVSSIEAPHILNKNGLGESLPTPMSHNGVMFQESNLRTFSRDASLFSSGPKECQSCSIRNTGAVDSSNVFQGRDMPGEQTSASSLSSRDPAEREALSNANKEVNDVIWVEFQIVDTGIGISGTTITNLSIFGIFLPFRIFLYQLSLCRNSEKLVFHFQILDWSKVI